jgi:tetratricopeptide (TPR) repeat protein
MRSYVESPVLKTCSALLILAASAAGCSGAMTTEANSRPQMADKWYQRAEQHFQAADVEEAHDSVAKALTIVPTDTEVRMLAARIALARLEFAEALRFLKGLKSTEASGLRGRALWYKGDMEAAADELEAMLDDPDVKDDWAKGIAKLARRGAGRTPFTLSGGLLAAVDMPHVNPIVPFFIVPLEIDGDSALAMISTGMAELVLDSSTRQEPSWVSLRFGKRLEVHDVPALTQDLSGISREIGAPIKALMGVNLLRHLNITIDYAGHQFVARSYEPPAPPNATRVNIHYYRGGGMVLKSGLSADKSKEASLLIDTSMRFPIALDQAGWKKAGVDAKDLKLIPEDPEQRLRQGVVPVIRLGAYDVPQVPGVLGPSLADIEKVLNPLDLDGVVGAGLLAFFRITLGDDGRTMWIEDNSEVQKLLEQGRGPADLPEPALEPPAGISPSDKSPAPAPTQNQPKTNTKNPAGGAETPKAPAPKAPAPGKGTAAPGKKTTPDQ